MSATAVGVRRRQVGRLWLTAALMPLGPLLVGFLRFNVLPDPIGPAVSAEFSRQTLVLWLGTAAMLTLIPGAYAAVSIVRRRGPIWAGWVAALLIPGYLAMPVLIAIDATSWAGTDLGLAPATVTDLTGRVSTFPAVVILTVVFIAGHVIGTVLLGVAAYRLQLMPKPVAVLLAISQLIHLAAATLVINWLDLIGWSLTALGMAYLARRLVADGD